MPQDDIPAKPTASTGLTAYPAHTNVRTDGWFINVEDVQSHRKKEYERQKTETSKLLERWRLKDESK